MITKKLKAAGICLVLVLCAVSLTGCKEDAQSLTPQDMANVEGLSEQQIAWGFQVNSKGQSYGGTGLLFSDADSETDMTVTLGVLPDLVEVVSHDEEHGYVAKEDYFYSPNSPGGTIRISGDETEVFVPLYDSEGEEIGSYIISEGVAPAERALNHDMPQSPSDVPDWLRVD